MVANSNTRANGGSAIAPVAVVYIRGCCMPTCSTLLSALVYQKINLGALQTKKPRSFGSDLTRSTFWEISNEQGPTLGL